MMVHIVFALTIILSYVLRKKGKQVQIIPFFILFLFAALRYMYGNDYSNYYYIHAYIQSGGGAPFDEFLFDKLFEVVPNFFLLIAIISYVFLLAVYKLMSNNLSGTDMFWGTLIFILNPYLFLMNLSALRQCLAMVCFMGGVHFGIKRKFIPYVAMILIGSLFHKSALILIPVYFILGAKPFRKRYILLVVGLLFGLLWVADISAIVQWSASWFNDANYMLHAESDLGNSIRATLLTGITFVYVLANMPALSGKDLAYAKLYLIGVALGILAYRLSMLTRIQMYFDIFSIVTIPTIMTRVAARGAIVVDFENKQKTVWEFANRYLFPMLIFMVYVLRYYSFFTNPSWQSFATYQTIFSVL